MRRFLFLSAFLLAGISNALFGQLLYVGNGGDDTISSYVIDQESGLLTELLPRVATTGSPSSVAIHPNGKFVYVTNGGNANLGVNGPSIAIFSINAGTGALTLANSLSLTPGTGPAGAEIDPSGKFLFFANSGAGNVSVYTIDASTGSLSPVPGSPFAAIASVNKVVVHPSGKFLYASAGPTGQVLAYSVAANGALTQITGSPFAGRTNIIWMTMDAAGKFLFAIERQDSAVLVYAVDATSGALTQVGAPAPSGPGVSGVAVDKAGKFLYIANTGNNSVNVFSIGATGALTQGRAFPAVFGAFTPILDPTGKFLYTVGMQAGAIQGSTIDTNTGAPTPLVGQQFFFTGPNPQRGAAVLLSPPVVPPMIAAKAVNQFSLALPGMPYAGVAPGSRLRVLGQNLGPALKADASPDDSALTPELGGSSIQIQSGDVTTAVLMIQAANGSVTGLVPSTTPLGEATVTVTYKGRTSVPLPITIVPIAPGVRTLSEQGQGPAKAYNAPAGTVALTNASVQTSNGLNQSAKPGQPVVVQATGLGAVTIDETQSIDQELDVPVDVMVGNKAVTAISKVRELGTDYVLFNLPADAPEGCYVPIALRAGGMTSNVATVSISATGGSCTDPFGLAAADIDAAQRSGQISMGTIVLNHLDLGPLGGEDGVNGRFVRYAYPDLAQAFSPGDNGGAIRSSFVTPPLGTCTALPGSPTRDDLFDTPSDQTPFQDLNIGTALNLNGPGITMPLPAPNYKFEPDDSFVKSGDYTVDNGAGAPPAIGPFKAAINLPPMVKWTNQDALTSVDRTQDLTVTWTGGVPDKEFALIAGIGVNQQAVGGFLCTEKVSAGKFTIPAWILSSIPKSDVFPNEDGTTIPGGLLGIGTASFTSAGRFSATGLNFGVMSYEQATIGLTLYQ